MGWQDDPIVTAAPVKAPWESDPIVYKGGPKIARGIGEAISAGYQGSLAGLIDRGKTPDIVLSPTDSKWYERAAAGVSQIVNEGPEMVAGSLLGMGAGAAQLNPVSVAAIGGAGAFAVPTIIRTAYAQAIKAGEIDSTTGFIDGYKIASKHFTDPEVLKAAGISAATGAISMGTGKYIEPFVAAGLGSKVIAGDIGTTTARVGTDAARLTTEGALMTVTPAALEGRLPEPHEFMDAAILLGGIKAASHVGPKLLEIYKATGKTPIEVMQDIQKEPAIKEELLNSTEPTIQEVIANKKLQDEDLAKQVQGMTFEEIDQAHKDAVSHNDSIELKGIEKFLGKEKYDEYSKLGTRRAKDNWLEKNLTNEAQDWISNHQVNESLLKEFRDSVWDFDKESPELLGRSISLISKNVDNPNFFLTPEGMTFKNAMQYAKEQGWDMEKVLSGMRERSAEWAGNDAPELFNRLFKQATTQTIKITTEPKRIVIGKPTTTNVGEKETVTLFRGVKTGGDTTSTETTVGNARFLSPDESIAKMYAGENGVISSEKITFNNLLVADTWVDAKAKLGLDMSATMADLISEARKAGYDGLTFKTTNGKEYIHIPEVKAKDTLGEYGPEIPSAYKALAEVTNAKDAVPDPSPEQAKALVEQPFAEIPQAPGEPILPTHVNYNYLNTTAEVKGALARLSGLFENKILESTRGTVSNEQTYLEAKKMLDDLVGGTSERPALEGADYVRLSADIYAKKQLLISGAERLMELRDEYLKAKENGEATDKMKLELLAQQERVALALAESRGAQAEVGRALQILKSVNRDKAYYDKLGKLLDSRFGVDGPFVGSAKFDAMVDMMGDMDTPKKALEFANKASKATTWEKIVEAWKASILSGPVTHISNVVGNTTYMALRPLVDAFALIPNKLGSKEQMSALEPFARIYGNIQGVMDGARFAWDIFKGAEVDGKAEIHRKAIEGTLGEVIRTPFRLLGGADAFFRVMNERGEAYSLAMREATKEGYNIDTREFKERVNELVQNPTGEMQQAINDAGIRFTFNSPTGDFGHALQNMVTTAHLEMVVSFIRTPGNILKEMFRLTPLAPMVKEWRQDFSAGGVRKDKAMAEIALGTSISSTVAMLTMSGLISGQGDPDPKKRSIQLAAGWQPYSIKVGDTWHSYQRLQPIGTLMGMAADAVSIIEHATSEERDKLGKIVATAFSNAVTNQTFLQGVTGIVDAISDPDRNGAKYIQRMAASFVPALLGQSAQMMDPYTREVYGIVDAVKNRIPGQRETLMPKRDPYGEPVPSPERMVGISPIVTSTESKDKVRMEAKRLGVGVGQTPKGVDVSNIKEHKLTNIELTPEQRDVFATESGRLAHQILAQMVEMPMWDGLSNMNQKMAFDNVFSHVKKYGQMKALPPEQIAEKAHEIASEIQRRNQPEVIEASKK